jgi:hypothetical protein
VAEEASYQGRRAEYRSGGGDADGVILLHQLGGQPEEGNWFAPDSAAYPFPVEHDDAGIWPLSPAGNRFWYVAEVAGWRYRSSGADSILLFFEPVERLALVTFDWS